MGIFDKIFKSIALIQDIAETAEKVSHIRGSFTSFPLTHVSNCTFNLF